MAENINSDIDNGRGGLGKDAPPWQPRDVPLAGPPPVATDDSGHPPSVLVAPHGGDGKRGTARRARRLVLRGVGLLAVVIMLICGLRLRSWIFPAAAPLYFRADMANAWYWGSFADSNARVGDFQAALRPSAIGPSWIVFWHRITTIYDRAAHQGNYRMFHMPLDYPPGRMTVIAAWVQLERTLHPKRVWFQPASMSPLLWFNTALELLGAVGFFFLVRHWVNRSAMAAEPNPWRRRAGILVSKLIRRRDATLPTRGEKAVRGIKMPARSDRAWMLGVLAAAVFWFNPAVIQSAHTWVQYDVWVIPFYVWALYFGSLDLFVLAGAVLAVGSLLKGQELFGAPMFVLWPLFAGWPRRALDVVIGALATLGLCLTPFMLHNPLDYLYLAGVAVAVGAAACWLVLRGRLAAPWYCWFMAPAVGLILWPLACPAVHHFIWPGMALAAWVAGLPIVIGRRRVAWYALSSFGLSMVVIALALPANMLWLKMGYIFGASTAHSSGMLAMPNACGLGAILQDRYGWHVNENVFTLHVFGRAVAVTMRTLLGSLYLTGMLLCAAGAARWRRRNDPRFLLAMIAPWIIFFAVAPQMYERYLLWGAGLLASAGVAVGRGYALLGILLSLISVEMTLSGQLRFNGGTAPKLYRILTQTQPGLGYAILLAAAICLYGILFSGPRMRTELTTMT